MTLVLGLLVLAGGAGVYAYRISSRPAAPAVTQLLDLPLPPSLTLHHG